MPQKSVFADLARNQVEDHEDGLWVRKGAPPPMESPHRHNDMEINFVVDGVLEYQFGGEIFRVNAGTIAIFWAAAPHRLLETSTGHAFWIHIPMSSVFQWALSDRSVTDLLRMRPLTLPSTVLPYEAHTMFEQWHLELLDPPTAPIAEIEAQGLIRRILNYRENGHHLHNRNNVPDEGMIADSHLAYSQTKLTHVAALSRYTAKHFRQDLSMGQIAESVGLSVSYAMTTFKDVTGMTLGKYLTWCRVSEAQRLLLTTDYSVSDVAAESGFSSLSSFYSHFTTECGVSPGKYRIQARRTV